ncbi:MAG: hypothetical protein HY558_08395 [Euryarchaeota archaeon]|nr:hypothetical protein [Euryarchaeota archaeon]
MTITDALAPLVLAGAWGFYLLALCGMLQARRGRGKRHHRMMLTAAGGALLMGLLMAASLYAQPRPVKYTSTPLILQAIGGHRAAAGIVFLLTALQIGLALRWVEKKPEGWSLAERGYRKHVWLGRTTLALWGLVAAGGTYTYYYLYVG